MTKQHLYFIGIAGHAMRGLALAARDTGYIISGLDETAIPPGSDWLDQHKLDWHRTFDPVQLEGVDAVIVTGTSADPQVPVLVAAREANIPVKSFAQLFGELTQGKHVIAVSGTHGKTTTTSLITWILDSAGRHPDFLIGIRPFNFDSSVRLAGSDIAVVEGDEYRASGLEDRSKVQYYHPDVLAITSVEHDHPDYFKDLAAVVARFQSIAELVPSDGTLVAWAESETVLAITESASCDLLTYGLTTGDYTARDIAYLPTGIEFDVETSSGTLGRIAVPLYGKHNVLNTLASVAVTLSEKVSMEQIVAGAATFRGAYRRFNLLTEPDARITVIDDYAHHPTEVATTIEAAKLHFAGRRIIAVFRPHTYSRTAALIAEYGSAFTDADHVFITEIEGAREHDSAPAISGQDVAKRIGKNKAEFAPDRHKLVQSLKQLATPGDVVLCMTVSGYENLAEELVRSL